MPPRRRASARRPAVRVAGRPESSSRALASLLYDDLTRLPTVPVLLGRVRRLLQDAEHLGLLSISILQGEPVEQMLGWQGYETLIRGIATFLVEIKRVALRREDYIAEVMISGNAFVIVLEPPRGARRVSYTDLDAVRQRIARKLLRFVRDRLPVEIQERFGLYVGCAVLTRTAGARFERLVYAALEEAFTDSLHQRRRQQRDEALRLKEILKSGAVSVVYQPVVDLRDRRVLGYEALTRVSAEAFSGPDHLFKVAHENDAVWRLEQLCRDRAIRGARGLPGDQLLFLNIEPDTVNDPVLRSESTAGLLRASALKPTQIVLEMTEHSKVHDFQHFRQLLNYFQFQGFRLALDDVGSGYSGLQTIAEIKPDFIKIDMALIRELHLHPIKQDLTATIVRFSTQSGVMLIAEGVETIEELRCLQGLGVRFAQGYLFARPGPPFPAPRLDLIG
jgi:EAL domain-containing protein (putative c-di-GMP-specific phosphodiesterase class I)